MPTDCPAVLVLDLDGVIIKSNLIKHDALLSLFPADRPRRQEISRFILANGGVRRDEKMSAIFRDILGIPAEPELLAQYLARYARALDLLLAQAPLVEGIAGFVGLREHLVYVSSSAPDHEVIGQLRRTGLIEQFAGAFGASTPKPEALRIIRDRHRPHPVVFFGDSLGDLRAARDAGVGFVAVVAERDNLPDTAVLKLQDFSSYPLVRACIESSCR